MGSSAPQSENERWSRDLCVEIDESLKRGITPDARALSARFPGHTDEIRVLVEMRTSLFEEGLTSDADARSADDDDADSDGGDEALGRVQERFQEAANRGEKPDLDAMIAEFPEHEAAILDLARFYSFVTDALAPEDYPRTRPRIEDLQLGRYRLVKVSGRHPLGDWVVGMDQQANQPVELLLIRARLSSARAARMLRDAAACGGFDHPGIAPLIEVGSAGQIRYLAYRYQSEISLERIVRRLRRGGGDRTLMDVLEATSEPGRPFAQLDEPLPLVPAGDQATPRLLANRRHVRAALRIGLKMADALDAAHARGLLLLDTRPSSVVLDCVGAARLRGFGIVAETRKLWLKLGTEGFYLAPEVRSDRPVDWRADVFGLGTLLFSLLSLEEPPDFAAIQNRKERLAHALPGVAPAVIDLLNDALDPDPAKRLPSAAAFAERLRPLVGEPTAAQPIVAPAPPSRVWALLATAALIAAVSLGAWVLLGTR